MENRIHMYKLSIVISGILFCLLSCRPASSNEADDDPYSHTTQDFQLPNPDLPVIGLLAYDGVLTTEVTAPLDVFTKPTETGAPLFNVIIVAETTDPVISEEGLTIIPNVNFENCPTLDVIFVPSAYDMSARVKDQHLINFIRRQNQHTTYTVSNCAGAQLIGEAGIAEGKKIVTWIGGGKDLQAAYPNLLVQNDSLVTYIEDGKFLSSNGNLASYISSLELLEKMTSPAHRKFVTSYLYLDRLQGWRE